MDNIARNPQDEMNEDEAVEYLLEAEEAAADAPHPMSMTELEYHVNQLAQDAYTFSTGKLTRERKQAIEYYLGQPFGNEKEGRSKIVLSEVRDTIEWVKPALIKIFTQTAQLGKMEPEGPEDEQEAEQRTDFANFVFYRDNPGFMILYDWFTDALMQKVGFVKTYWDAATRVERFELTGITERQLMQLDADPAIEITNFDEVPGQVPMGEDEFGNTILGEGVLFDVQGTKTEDRGRVRIEVVPPEEVRVNRNCKRVEDAVFLQHRRTMMESELIELGYDAKMVRNLPAEESGEFDEEEVARETVDDEPGFSTEQRTGATRELAISEIYVQADVDGDGIAELLKVMMAGEQKGKIFDVEPAEEVPFSSLCPVPMPHRLFGLSVADLVEDLQLINSEVMRQILNGLYLANNPRWGVIEGKANISDILRNVPGGPIRQKERDAVWPMQQAYNVAESGLPILEYLQTVKERRTGVSSTYQAIDVDALNKTAFGVSQLMGQAAQRIEMIARIFAETGVKDMFGKIDGLVMRNQSIARTVRLRNEWVEVDPMSWDHKMDATINVGLGSGSREAMAMNLQGLGQLMERIGQQFPGMVTPAHAFKLFEKVSENLGFKNATEFMANPEAPGYQPPEPEPDIDELKLKLEERKVALEDERERMKIQADHRIKLMEVRLKFGQLTEKLIEEERLLMQQEHESRANGGA